MIKFEHVVLPSPEQMEFDIEGVRNAFRSWDRMDSDIDCENPNNYILGPNDSKLCKSLAYAGAEHRKFMRSMQIRVRVTAPLYWWKEYDTYKIGTVTESESTMHTIAQREFSLDDFSVEHLMNVPGEGVLPPLAVLKTTIDTLNAYRKLYVGTPSPDGSVGTSENRKDIWWQMIQLLPSSYNQTRNITLSYEAAANIYRQRKHHKLDEWREFCSFLETLPYPEFIVGKDCNTTVLYGDDKQTVITTSADEIRIGTIPANKIKAHNAMLLKKGDTIC